MPGVHQHPAPLALSACAAKVPPDPQASETQACPPFRGFGNEPGVYLKETPQGIVEQGVMPSFAESQRDHVVWNLCRSYASYRFTKSGQNQTSSSAGAKAEVDLRRAAFGVVFLPPTQWTSERTRKTCHKCIEGSKAVGAMHSESQCLFAASPLHESVYEPMALLHHFEDHLGVVFFFIPSICEVKSMVNRDPWSKDLRGWRHQPGEFRQTRFPSPQLTFHLWEGTWKINVLPRKYFPRFFILLFCFFGGSPCFPLPGKTYHTFFWLGSEFQPSSSRGP